MSYDPFRSETAGEIAELVAANPVTVAWVEFSIADGVEFRPLVSWPAVPGAERYRLFASDDGGVGWQYVAEVEAGEGPPTFVDAEVGDGYDGPLAYRVSVLLSLGEPITADPYPAAAPEAQAAAGGSSATDGAPEPVEPAAPPGAPDPAPVKAKAAKAAPPPAG